MIGEIIGKYLSDNGITQTFVCEKTGISNNALHNMIYGKRNITIDEYFKICNALQVPSDKFKIESEQTQNSA